MLMKCINSATEMGCQDINKGHFKITEFSTGKQ